MAFYHENQAMNGQNIGSFSSWVFRRGFSGHDCLKIREKILDHEMVFRNQLLELHRLYERQKELMDEVRRGSDRHLVHEKFPAVPQASYDGDIELSLHTIRRSPCYAKALTLDLVSKGFSQNPMAVTNWENSASFTMQGKERTQVHLPCNVSEKNTWMDQRRVGEFFPGRSSASHRSQNAEPRLAGEGQPVSIQKRKLFGVEISEHHEVSKNVVPGMLMNNTKDGNNQGNHCLASRSFNSSDGSNLFSIAHHKEHGRKNYDENSYHFKSKPAENLPWFLRKLNERDDVTKGMESSYFMNLESLQHCKHSFFKKTEPENMDLHNGIPAQNAAPSTEVGLEKHHDLMMATENASISDRIETQANKHSEKEPTNGCISAFACEDAQLSNTCTRDMRHQIDLNLSLDEEHSPVQNCITTIVKIETTEIDLEAPVVHEFDADVSPKEAEMCEEEFDRRAAEALIAFSLHQGQGLVHDKASSLPEDESSHDLKWFAELIFSEFSETGSTQVGKESIPEGMDHFEFMTLKLEDCKGKNYDYQPVIFDDDKGSDNISTRTGRQSRRGKPRKDFQRDILPGMVTLSRVQVAEDLQSFDELMKAQGKAWQSSLSQRGTAKNGRGRKRMITPETPSKRKLIGSSRAPQQPLWQPQERSLTGWGKRTRRLPRQRCLNGYAAFPIKC